MAAAADVIFVDGTIYPTATPKATAEALAVRDGTVRRVADTYEVEFLEGIETRRIDLDGRTVVPGFVDAGADLLATGRGQRGEATGSEQPSNAGRETVQSAIDHAIARGVTSVSETVTEPSTARVLSDLAAAGELPLRVGLSYFQRPQRRSEEAQTPPDFLRALRTLGLDGGFGRGMVRVDSLALDVASWDRSALRTLLDAAGEAGLSITAGISDHNALETLVAVQEAVSIDLAAVQLETVPNEAMLDSLLALDAPVVTGPTVLTASDAPLGHLLAAGIPVQFGSHGGSIRPLRWIDDVTGGPANARVGTAEALQIGTGGPPGSPRRSPIQPGQPADFAVLSGSPWETPPADLSVEMTVVGGQVVYEDS